MLAAHEQRRNATLQFGPADLAEVAAASGAAGSTWIDAQPIDVRPSGDQRRDDSTIQLGDGDLERVDPTGSVRVEDSDIVDATEVEPVRQETLWGAVAPTVEDSLLTGPAPAPARRVRAWADLSFPWEKAFWGLIVAAAAACVIHGIQLGSPF